MRETTICELMQSPVDQSADVLRSTPAHDSAGTVLRASFEGTQFLPDTVDDVMRGECLERHACMGDRSQARLEPTRKGRAKLVKITDRRRLLTRRVADPWGGGDFHRSIELLPNLQVNCDGCEH